MIFALISVVLNASAQLALKKATSFNVSSLQFLAKNPYLYLTAFLYLTSIVTWFFALSRLQVSVAYPLQAIGYILVTFAALILFREPVNRFNWIGICLILIGVILTQAGRQ